MQSEKYKGLTIEYKPDPFPPNPLTEFSSFGTIVTYHRKYELGDVQLKSHPGSWPQYAWHMLLDDKPDLLFKYTGTTDVDRAFYFMKHSTHYMLRAIRAPSEAGEWLPVYIYDHGNITLRTTKFHCPWDSGQIGIIYATAEEILHEFPDWKPHDGLDERPQKLMMSIINQYADYVSGNVWKYCIKSPDGKTLDSCSGYFGFPDAYMLPEVRSMIDNNYAEESKQAMALDLD